MSATITPAKSLQESHALQHGHSLEGMTKTIYKGINSKESATAALADEMNMNLEDVRFLQRLVKKKGPLELVEGTKGYKRFNEILRRLEAQGNPIDLSKLRSEVKKGGKTVLVFDESQKKELKEKLDGMEKLTEHSKQENQTKLQKLASEERDLWNLLSNLIKVYYDQVKSILSDANT